VVAVSEGSKLSNAAKQSPMFHVIIQTLGVTWTMACCVLERLWEVAGRCSQDGQHRPVKRGLTTCERNHRVHGTESQFFIPIPGCVAKVETKDQMLTVS
jgi:hypothetical protein